MLDVFILSSVTYKLIQKRSKKREGETSPEVEVLEGRGDQIFKKFKGEKFNSGLFIGVFFLFIFLRVALYAPIFNFSLDVSVGKYGVIDLDYSDRLQDEIVRFGIQGLTLLVPVWLPVVAGLNLVNQLDKDFPQKQEYKRLSKGCEAKVNFEDCERLIIFHHMDDSPEDFEKAISHIKKFMTDERQICDVYERRYQYYLRHDLFERMNFYRNERCKYEVCGSCGAYYE